MDWRDYENQVFEYFKNRFPNSKIERNVKLPGRLSNTKRELDILLTETVFGCSMQLVIECKSWKSKLDTADVGSFIDKLNDVGIKKGIVISRYGYSNAAHSRARAEINVQLQVLDFENLSTFYGFWGIPYRGNFGAIISAPNGWVVNNIIQSDINTLCYLHPLEYEIQAAAVKRLLMYFQIYPIIDNYGLKETFKYQDDTVRHQSPNSKIEYWDEINQKGRVTYRKIEYNVADYVEFTAGVESYDFFAYCVCIVPINFHSDDLARLKYVVENMHLIKIDNIDPANSDGEWNNLFNGVK